MVKRGVGKNSRDGLLGKPGNPKKKRSDSKRHHRSLSGIPGFRSSLILLIVNVAWESLPTPSYGFAHSLEPHYLSSFTENLPWRQSVHLATGFNGDLGDGVVTSRRVEFKVP